MLDASFKSETALRCAQLSFVKACNYPAFLPPEEGSSMRVVKNAWEIRSLLFKRVGDGTERSLGWEAGKYCVRICFDNGAEFKIPIPSQIKMYEELIQPAHVNGVYVLHRGDVKFRKMLLTERGLSALVQHLELPH